jgi:RNA recognition motif-containing protein
VKPGDPRNVFIGNLSYGATIEDVRAAFAGVGDLTGVRVPIDFETGRARGFAFVTYATEAEAQRAISELDGALILGRPIIVKPATGGGRTDPRWSGRSGYRGLSDE